VIQIISGILVGIGLFFIVSDIFRIPYIKTSTGGLPPLGYDVDPATKKLIINEKESIAVQLIFDLFVQGLGYDKIINELNLRGYKTKTGKAFGHNSIHNIIRNQKYIGTYIFNRSAAKDVDGKRNSHSNKDIEEIIRIEHAVPQIINDEIFEQAQQKIIARQKTRPCNNVKEVYLLSGKIFCGECGFTMGGNKKLSGRSKSTHITYRCLGRKNKHICTNKEIRREYIESYVLEVISEYTYAKGMYLCGGTEERRQLINLYLDKVVVYQEHIEFFLNTLPVSILKREVSRATEELDDGDSLLTFMLKNNPHFEGEMLGYSEKTPRSYYYHKEKTEASDPDASGYINSQKEKADNRPETGKLSTFCGGGEPHRHFPTQGDPTQHFVFIKIDELKILNADKNINNR